MILWAITDNMITEPLDARKVVICQGEGREDAERGPWFDGYDEE